MANRLSKVVTRTGDAGETGLADGTRLAKHAPRIAALGSVDELNSHLGVLLAEPLDADSQELLIAVQNDLFDLGGELALPERPVVDATRLARLDAAIAHLNADLPPLREFILPGGDRAAALAHVCRATCRRAERDLWALDAIEPLNQDAPRYLNRLSDLLFVLARVLNRRAGQAETCWRGPERR
jgi:cob(I)alamin adenosyltransferase